MVAPAVAGKHPLKGVGGEFVHRADLFGPGVEAVAAKGVQLIEMGRPSEMIAAEEKLLAVEQNGVASGVAGNGNDQEIGSEFYRICAGELNFDGLSFRSNVIAVENAIAAEMVAEFLMIGDIVLMGQV